MQLTARSSNFLSRKHRQSLAGPRGPSRHAAEVVNAYIAIRDRLLEESKKIASAEILDRLSIANDLVFTCLRPARAPYDAQFLPEADAARERNRCEKVQGHVARLRGLVAAAVWR
ncbi:MAG: hypothetical protein ABJB69_04685 [Spartobacteria bacterium]